MTLGMRHVLELDGGSGAAFQMRVRQLLPGLRREMFPDPRREVALWLHYLPA
jgi:hypothetical protein